MEGQSVSKPRYETCGDYFYDDKGVLNIQTLELDNDIYNCLVMIHEMVEWVGITKAGIFIEDIEEYDHKFGGIDVEPGEQADCPYRLQHEFAELIERMVCNRFGIDYLKYCEIINQKMTQLYGESRPQD